MDICLAWDTQTAVGDWQFTGGDIQNAVGQDELATAILVSLFTDAPASPDYTGTDRRGWWGNTPFQSIVGSRLWQLERAKKSAAANVLLQARDYTREALQWLIDDGIAAGVAVSTSWISREAIGIAVSVTEPDQRAVKTFDFSWAWATPTPVLMPAIESVASMAGSILDQNFYLDESPLAAKLTLPLPVLGTSFILGQSILPTASDIAAGVILT